MPWKDKEAHREQIRAIALKSSAKRRATNVDANRLYQREYAKKRRAAGLDKSYLNQIADPIQREGRRKYSRKRWKLKRKELNEAQRKKTQNLDDYYIIKQLRREEIPLSIIKSNPVLIEAKRQQLKIKRLYEKRDYYNARISC